MCANRFDHFFLLKIKHIEGDLLTGLAFTPSAVLTAARSGVTKLWVRPLALRPRAARREAAGTPAVTGAGAR